MFTSNNLFFDYTCHNIEWYQKNTIYFKHSVCKSLSNYILHVLTSQISVEYIYIPDVIYYYNYKFMYIIILITLE